MENQQVEYVGIGQAAKMLDINPATLRNWDKIGKLVAERHLGSRFRFYNKAVLQEFIARLEQEAHEKGIIIMKKNNQE